MSIRTCFINCSICIRLSNAPSQAMLSGMLKQLKPVPTSQSHSIVSKVLLGLRVRLVYTVIWRLKVCSQRRTTETPVVRQRRAEIRLYKSVRCSEIVTRFVARENNRGELTVGVGVLYSVRMKLVHSEIPTARARVRESRGSDGELKRPSND
jgi:hypothetical protein